MFQFLTFVMVALMFVPFAFDNGAKVVNFVKDKTSKL